MIIRLAVRELTRRWQVWVGTFIVTVAAAAGIVAVLLNIVTAASSSPDQSKAIFSLAYAEFAFLILAAASTTAVTAKYAVAATKTGYARMQFAGVLPSQVLIIVVLQLCIVSLLGSLIGAGIGAAVAQPLLDYTVAQTSIESLVRVRFSGTTCFFGAAMSTLILTTSGIRAAYLAGKIPAVQALRSDPERNTQLTSTGRRLAIAVFFGICVAIAGGVLSVHPDPESNQFEMDVSTVVGLGILLGLAMLALFSVSAPILTKFFIRAWTSLVPKNLATSWLVARRTISYDNSRSAATLVPVLLTIGLPGTLYTVFLTTTEAFKMAGSGSTAINSGAIVVLLGPALTIAALGAATIVFMGGTARSRDHALLALNGATRGLAARISLFESLIYVVSSLILTTVAMTIVGVVVSAGLSHESEVSLVHLGCDAALLSALCTFLLLSIMTISPVLLSSRHELLKTLASTT